MSMKWDQPSLKDSLKSRKAHKQFLMFLELWAPLRMLLQQRRSGGWVNACVLYWSDGRVEWQVGLSWRSSFWAHLSLLVVSPVKWAFSSSLLFPCCCTGWMIRRCQKQSVSQWRVNGQTAACLFRSFFCPPWCRKKVPPQTRMSGGRLQILVLWAV